jgi:hypothetical protein
MEHEQQKQRAATMQVMQESKMASYGAVRGAGYAQDQTLSSPSVTLNKSSPIDADLNGMERELNVLIDSIAILRQRLNPVLCAGFEFEETPGEPMRDGSPISYRLNVFRSCVREATNRVEALGSGLEI